MALITRIEDRLITSGSCLYSDLDLECAIKKPGSLRPPRQEEPMHCCLSHDSSFGTGPILMIIVQNLASYTEYIIQERCFDHLLLGLLSKDAVSLRQKHQDFLPAGLRIFELRWISYINIIVKSRSISSSLMAAHQRNLHTECRVVLGEKMKVFFNLQLGIQLP